MEITAGETLKYQRQNRLQLSQLELAELLGMGVATINRYERGAVPTPAHQQLIESLSDPEALLRLMQGKENKLGAPGKRLEALAHRELLRKDLMRVAETQRQYGTPATSGKRQFDLERLTEMVRFFTEAGEWKTKLNKLLFYADFMAFRDLGKSISGTRYVIGPFGPIPDEQESLYIALIKAEIIEPKEEFLQSGDAVEKLYARTSVNRRVFSIKELGIMDSVKEFFRIKTSRQVAEYSHEEQAYKSYSSGEAIPYEEAKELREIKISHKAFKSFAQIAREAAAKIPAAELAKLPEDSSENMDHYLYGSPKRKK